MKNVYEYTSETPDVEGKKKSSYSSHTEVLHFFH